MKMKNQFGFGVFGILMTSLACSISTITPITPTPADQVGTIVAATMQALTAAPSQSASMPNPTGMAVSYENVSFVIPNGLASAANPEKMTAVDTNSGAPWEIAPTHLRFSLIGYPLQGKFFEPQIFVYSADAYAQVNPAAGEQIERLKKAAAGSPLLKETLPNVPFFNAAHLMSARIQL